MPSTMRGPSPRYYFLIRRCEISTMSDRDYFQEGIDLFNAGRYFECHEAWEQVWNRTQGDDKLVIQGLIQAAVAILHLERDNREGAESLYAKACAKLALVRSEFRTLDIERFCVALKEFFDAARPTNRDRLPERPRLIRFVDAG